MKKYQSAAIDFIPVLFGVALVVMAAAQFMNARRELDQSRASCYAEVGREQCDSVR